MPPSKNSEQKTPEQQYAQDDGEHDDDDFDESHEAILCTEKLLRKEQNAKKMHFIGARSGCQL